MVNLGVGAPTVNHWEMMEEKAHNEAGDQEGATNLGGKPAFTTFGQNFHKWSTYISVDWVLNYAAGVLFSCWARYTKLGQGYWFKPVTGAATYISKDIL